MHYYIHHLCFAEFHFYALTQEGFHLFPPQNLVMHVTNSGLPFPNIVVLPKQISISMDIFLIVFKH